MARTAEHNAKIKASFKATQEKRKSQVCRVYKFKIQKNKLSAEQKKQLKMIFVESKWLYNDILRWTNLDTKNKVNNYEISDVVLVKNKDDVYEERTMNFIKEQSKQGIQAQISAQIKGLSALKKKGKKVGRLKFKSEISSINLKQYGSTHRIINDHYVKIQGVHGKVRVNGIDQIKDDVEFANAKLLKRGNDYYLSVTTYIDKSKVNSSPKIHEDIGIDMGCSTSFTFSNGKKLDVKVKETERLVCLQRKKAKQKKGSNNSRKTIMNIRKQHDRICNIKNDWTNKIIAELRKYRIVAIQDEQLQKWKETGHGKAIQHSILGRVKKFLQELDNCIVVDKWKPTSKRCFHCGNIHPNLTQWDRTFVCPHCGVKMDRDVHAALNIVYEALIVAVERSKITPVEMNASIQLSLNKLSSSKQEAATL